MQHLIQTTGKNTCAESYYNNEHGTCQHCTTTSPAIRTRRFHAVKQIIHITPFCEFYLLQHEKVWSPLGSHAGAEYFPIICALSSAFSTYELHSWSFHIIINNFGNFAICICDNCTQTTQYFCQLRVTVSDYAILTPECLSWTSIRIASRPIITCRY